MLRPISPELVLFPDFWVSNIPRYFILLERYLGLTKMELSSFEAQQFRDNRNKSESYAIKSLQSRQDLNIKKQPKQTFPVELEIKDMTESNTSASYLNLILMIGRDGQLHTSIYEKQCYDEFNFHITNCHSWVAIYQHHQTLASLSRSLNDMPGHVPHMDVLFRGLCNFQISFSNRDTSRNAQIRHWGSFMVDTGILSNNMKFPCHKC